MVDKQLKMRYDINMKENRNIKLGFDGAKCLITDTGVNAGFNLNLRNIQTSDLKYLTYKITEELMRRGEL